ncbi:MAG TPA: wax ester/triacylglycerol synthase family O-acyltransferase [Acidimicrobiales bacterium]|jgi:WS/DGAT/MGAT family acyltransferase
MPITDAMFLLAERRQQPMHVGGLQVFRLPPGAGSDWARSMYEEMIDGPEISTLFRRRPHRPPSSLGAWSWELDNDIDLEHHVRHSALPRPGRVRELLALASRLHGVLLDRHRPLWEAHLIEGLQGKRFAVYTKVHHSLLDGVSALRLLERSLSADPEARHVGMPWSTPPERRPPTSSRGLLGLLGVPRAAWRTTTELVGLGPVAAKAALRALMDQSTYLPSMAPKTMLNVPITGARRYAAQSWPLARIRAVADASGTTINDVVLAMCAAALRRYLDGLGALPEAPLVAMTPVSLRQVGAEEGGNAVGAILCNLATDVDDPAARLAAVHDSMEAGKRSLRSMSPAQVTVASAVTLLPMLFSTVAGVRRVASPPYNLVISNIPGPTRALYWNGAQLEGVYPLSIPMDGQALNITVTSYHGNMEFGLTGCRRTLPHLQRLLVHLDESLGELQTAARA